MLEQMRRQSQSLIIYVLFGIIIAVFIISFGPQSVGGFKMENAVSSYAAKVGGQEVSMADYRWALQTSGAANVGVQQAKMQRLREQTMDKLIERELLIAEAERMGIRVTDEDVEDFIAQSNLALFGNVQKVPSVQKDGRFDFEAWKRFVQFQGLSQKAFMDQQRRELVALRVKDLLRQGVAVSESEVRDQWVRSETQVNLEYVRFPLTRYEDQVNPTAEEVAAYAAAHEAKLKEQYNERKSLYEKVPRELKLRQIQIKLDSGASDDAVAAAMKKADALAARIKKGETFAAVAKAASEDTRTRARGGDLGWKRQGATTLGAAIEDKVWKAKEGEVVGPDKGSDGVYLVVVEGAREGDLAFEKVKLELAEAEARKEQVAARAKADAEAAFAKAKAAPDKSLKDLFPAAQDGQNAKDGKAAKDAKPTAAPDSPSAQETGLFARRGDVVESIGYAPELAKAAFKLKKEEPLWGPSEVAGSYMVVRLKERHDADAAEWEKKKADTVASATMFKGYLVSEEWLQRRCQDAKDAKRITVNNEVLRYDDGQEGLTPYEPCAPRRNPFGF